MTLAIAVVAAPVAAPIVTQPPVTPLASSAQDVDRLRALISGVQPMGENVTVTANAPVTATEESGFNTLGDSILQGVAKFNTGYNDSLEGINAKLQDISNPLSLGDDFGKIMELQVEVARWSMSVMGVDNASKAGTNTIKELSKGG
jgi:hypothetical protein